MSFVSHAESSNFVCIEKFTLTVTQVNPIDYYYCEVETNFITHAIIWCKSPLISAFFLLYRKSSRQITFYLFVSCYDLRKVTLHFLFRKSDIYRLMSTISKIYCLSSICLAMPVFGICITLAKFCDKFTNLPYVRTRKNNRGVFSHYHFCSS